MITRIKHAWLVFQEGMNRKQRISGWAIFNIYASGLGIGIVAGLQL